MNEPAHIPTRTLRARRLRSAAAWGVAFQLVYALWQFAVLKMLYPHLGVERFGLWVTVFSLTMFSALGNIGVHQALLTHVGRFGPSGGGRRVDRTAWVATAIVGTAAAALFVLLLTVGWVLPWAQMLNVTDEAVAGDATPTAVAAMCLAALALPAMMGGIVVQARQLGGMRYAAACTVQLIDLVLVWLGVRWGWSLPTLALVMMAPPVVTGLWLWVQAYRRGLVRPRRPRAGVWAHAGTLLRMGGGFFLLELAGLLILQTGYLVIAHRLGLGAVVVYAAMFRLIGLLLTCALMVSQAYWPTFGEAWRRGDRAWFGQAMRQMGWINFGLWLAAAVVIVTLGPWFVEWWLGAEAVPTFGVMAGALSFAAAQLLLDVIETPLRGIGRMRTIVTAAAAGGVVMVPLAILGADWMGVSGVFIAQGVAVCVVVLVNVIGLSRLITSRGGGTVQPLLPGVLRMLHAPIARTPIAGWVEPLGIAKRVRRWRDGQILQRGEYTITLHGHTLRFPVTTQEQVIALDDVLSEEAFLGRLLESLQPGDVVYDVGANVGVVSILIVKHRPDVTVHSFEPVPEHAARLRENLALHDVEAVVHEIALGAGRGVGRTADALAAESQPPTVVKIDVEGAEVDVLRGMEAMLRRRQVRELFIEAHPGMLDMRGNMIDDIDQFLADFGYRLVWSQPRNLEIHQHYRLRGGAD